MILLIFSFTFSHHTEPSSKLIVTTLSAERQNPQIFVIKVPNLHGNPLVSTKGLFTDFGYAVLANLDPQYGLYGSVVPPLIYSVMGTSQELAIGPVAVVSLLISSMISKLVDPAADPVSYRKLVFTATFFASTLQALFGILRV